ncbi:MAG: tRNA uracil 4-sulfurtransferase ThiI [Halanaerobacter sp.]
MENLFLIRYGEIGTKGKNRYKFEDKLIENIEAALKELRAKSKVTKTFGRIFVQTDANKEDALERLSDLFGIVGICPAQKVNLDIEKIKEQSLELIKKELETRKERPLPFRITTNRSNKGFPLDTMEVNKELGAYLIANTPNGALEVDLEGAQLELTVEIRDEKSYIYSSERSGLGGLPIGTSDQAGLMLSGGIDSPVAAWLTMKRGVEIIPIYFHTPPFTSARAKEKVIDLAQKLAYYQQGLKLHIVNFTEIQQEINQNCHDDLITLIMRRQMIKIAQRIVQTKGAKALVTGESIAQVASQTLDAIKVTNEAAQLPILRPLVGFDKTEIIEQAREIGTYKISTKPAQDCCSLFVPQRPETHPSFAQITASENRLEVEELITAAINEVEVVEL